MKSKWFAVTVLIFIAASLTLTTNCDNVRLNLVQAPLVVAVAKVDGEICGLPPTSLENVTKVMFLVDVSGSNANTDADKSYRHDTIKQFVDKYSANPSVHWGFVTFGYTNPDPHAEALINAGDRFQAIFTNSSTAIYNALTEFKTIPNNGNTPYHKAIDMAIAAIKSDRATLQPGQRPNYVVVLISDGVPTDAEYGSPIDQIKVNLDAARFPAETATLSTIYYGPSTIVEAPVRLELMATAGKGNFSNVNVDGKVPLDQVLALKFGEPWLIKRFTVANMNAAPCDDGTMDADSDSDGICDKDELKYNQTWLNDPTYADFKSRMLGKKFDPQNRNSFSGIYNDLIFFKQITQRQAIDPSCIDISDKDHDFLNACEEAFIRVSSAAGPTADFTTKMKFDADPLNYDSDGDGFIDWLELVFERSNSAVMDYSSFRREVDGFRMDQIITQYRNPNNPAAGVPYDGSFRFSRINSEGQNCYTYHQTQLPTYATKPVTEAQVTGNADLVHGENESIIMISYIQTPQSDPFGPGELRYTFQKLKKGQSSFTLKTNYDDYQVYRASTARISTGP